MRSFVLQFWWITKIETNQVFRIFFELSQKYRIFTFLNSQIQWRSKTKFKSSLTQMCVSFTPLQLESSQTTYNPHNFPISIVHHSYLSNSVELIETKNCYVLVFSKINVHRVKNFLCHSLRDTLILGTGEKIFAKDTRRKKSPENIFSSLFGSLALNNALSLFLGLTSTQIFFA